MAEAIRLATSAILEKVCILTVVLYLSLPISCFVCLKGVDLIKELLGVTLKKVAQLENESECTMANECECRKTGSEGECASPAKMWMMRSKTERQDNEECK